MERRRFLLAGLALNGCAGRGTLPRKPPEQGFEAGQLVKTDIDRVVETHHREIFASLRLLTEKLYRRNPREWRKTGASGVEAALERLYGPPHGWRLAEFGGRHGVDLLQQVFRPDFAGDRVGALAAGLCGMVQAAFEDKTEFFVIDELDAQKLYNSARNVEIAVWKLSTSRDESGAPLLHSNEAGPPANLSFEREFGKLIGSLDVLAKIVADKSNRLITRVVQSFATAVFLPVR